MLAFFRHRSPPFLNSSSSIVTSLRLSPGEGRQSLTRHMAGVESLRKGHSWVLTTGIWETSVSREVH